ncbi:MAG: septum formation initiator family protein [Geminicoccaceae bacterium]
MTVDGFAYRSYGLRKQAVRHWLGVALVLVLAYFAYHSIHGSRGLFAWIDRQHELDTKRLELAQIRAERQWLEQRVEALGPDRLATDLLEETLLGLGFVNENEVVIFDEPPPQ